MSNNIKLLPCPFCSNADISIQNESPKDNSGGYFIECPGCGASTSLRFACGDDPTHLLAEQWNRRTFAHCSHHIQKPTLANTAPQAQDDSALLDAMERQRIAVVPEYEGPWDAEVYNDEGEPIHAGSGSTPREAIRAAIAAAKGE